MIATVISEISVTAYQFYVVRYELSIRQMMAEVWKYFLGGLMMFAVVLYLNLTVPFSMLQLGLQVGIGILVYGVVL
ncbi:polysaccharide biosynthesis C-terminal domain-containing protein, partial [Helicobacter pylori]